ncbi:hypothetical protein [Nonomuraea sp. NPDC049480]|uniref:hypothetical protein n=1 Tax=Nonomuraea sp. NPDC049480 TaxID=3364353 RepID=UPI003794A522
MALKVPAAIPPSTPFTAALTLSPCVSPEPGSILVALNPEQGGTIVDSSGHGRDATVTGGTATYDATAPTGSGLVLDGKTYMVTGNTTLGLLPEATFAAEVKIAGSGYRRQATSEGITGCTSRPLRFGADQGGGQRRAGAVAVRRSSPRR